MVALVFNGRTPVYCQPSPGLFNILPVPAGPALRNDHLKTYEHLFAPTFFKY